MKWLCLKPQNFGVVCYTASDPWDTRSTLFRGGLISAGDIFQEEFGH